VQALCCCVKTLDVHVLGVVVQEDPECQHRPPQVGETSSTRGAVSSSVVVVESVVVL
jgi:hypothetical protein